MSVKHGMPFPCPQWMMTNEKLKHGANKGMRGHVDWEGLERGLEKDGFCPRSFQGGRMVAATGQL